jgi:hypothetical protein
MGQWKVGDLVRHGGIPAWGVGKIIEISPSNHVTVFFVGSEDKPERKFAATSNFLISVGSDEPRHSLLDHLSVESVRAGRYVSLDQAKAKFLHKFPKGFYGQDYLDAERDYKAQARKLLGDLLGAEPFRSLVESGQHEEVCTRARKVMNATNLIFPNEKMALADALKVKDHQEPFSRRLFDLLHGADEMRDRFERFVACLDELKAAKWTTATYFLFLDNPDQHMFVKPSIIQNAAAVCAFKILYVPSPNWQTYRTVLELAAYLKTALDELRPRDMIDVQSFIWCIARY